MRILVMRLGSALTPQAHSDVGHGDETLALLEHLHDEHNVLALGRFGIDPLVPYHQLPSIGSHPNESVEACEALYAEAVMIAEDFAPDVIVTPIGPTGSACYPGQGVRVQAFSANYCGPVAAVWNALAHVPVIGILNDPRNVIRLKELRRFPDAVLTQTNDVSEHTCHGVRLRKWYRYHKTQNWGLPEPLREFRPRSGIGILAHRHNTDPRVAKNRDDVWEYILSGLPEHMKVECYGRGWPMGPLKGPEVAEFLQSKMWGPMIPIAEGWVTAKFGQYARHGCLPRPYDAGGYLTYDRDGLMIPLDHRIRWSPGEWDGTDQELLEWAWEITEPDWSSLDDCLTEAEAGRLPDFEKWGGYEVLNG
jgi:hypothetical protein